MEETLITPSKDLKDSSHKTTYRLIGAFVAGLSFIPILTLFIHAEIIAWIGPGIDTGEIFHIEYDWVVAFFFWIFALIIGPFFGSWGSGWIRNQSGHWQSGIGAVIGGLSASILLAIIATFITVPDGISEWKNKAQDQLRPTRMVPIHTLEGDFQEIVIGVGWSYKAISSDGSMVAYTDADSLNILDIENNTLVQSFTADTDKIRSLAFSSDGAWLASSSVDGKLVIWYIATGEKVDPLYENHQSFIMDIAVSPDGTLMASGDNDGMLILWNLANWTQITRLATGSDSISCLEFSPDNKILAMCAGEILDEDVLLLDLSQDESTNKFKALGLNKYGYHVIFNDISFSPNGRLLAIGEHNGPMVWDLEAQTLLGSFQYSKHTESVDFNPAGRWIVSSGEEMIYLWDAASKQPVGKIPAEDWHCDARFPPDGRLLVQYSYSSLDGQPGKIGIWTIKTP